MDSALVELNIFSGRPDPQWEIPFTQAMEWYREVLSLPVAEKDNPFDALGYRGFVLRIRRTGSPTLECKVFSGRIKVTEGAAAMYRKDNDRLLERRLLLTAKPNIEDALFRMVEQHLK